MKKWVMCLLGIGMSAPLMCASDTWTDISADNPDIMYMGRIHWSDAGIPSFTYPGTTAMLKFRGTGIAMSAKPGSGKFMVEIDGGEPVKINFAPADSMIVISDCLRDTVHNVRITYAIEGYGFRPEIRGFALQGILENAPVRPKLKMEFIGNSITCGYGTEEDDPHKGFSFDTENHILSYAYLTARALDADFNVVARSGIGMYRNYNGPKEGSPNAMPAEYDYTMLYNHDHKWDFSSFQPDIVCINLGTNDLSTNNYDLSLYESAYRNFLYKLYALYPDATVVLLTGSMLSGAQLDEVKGVLDRLAAENPGRCLRFDMSPQTGDLGFGADWHPSRRQAEKMARELTQFLKTVIANKRL